MENTYGESNIAQALQLISRATSILGGSASTSGIGTSSPQLSSRLGSPSTPQFTSPAAHPGRFTSINSPNLELPARNTTVIAELRRNFEPYRRPVMRGRSVGRPTAGSSRQTEPWSHRFCCLGGPADICTPSRSRLSQLQGDQLGHDHVFADRNASKEELTLRLEESYPLLRGASYEMLQAVGFGGGSGKPLRRLSSQHSSLSVPMILQSRILSIIYLRPLINLVQNEENSDTGDGNADDIEVYSSGSIAVSNVPIEEDEGNVHGDGDGGEIEVYTSGPNAATTMPLDEDSANLLDGEPERSQTTAGDPEIITMEDLRQSVYQENPGEQLVAVQRDDFCSEVLGVYKNPTFSLLKKPLIVFIGEAGRDVGALSKEYFWKGMNAIADGKICNLPLFEGEMDHKIPCRDGILLRSGKYKEIGKFISHASLHCGIGFVGLSPAVVEYLCAREISSDKILPICESDVPDLNVRDVIEKVDTWRSSGNDPDELTRLRITETATESGYQLDIIFENLAILRDQILYHQVIEMRKAQLDSIREGFQVTPVFHFLSDREFLIGGVFPSTTTLEIPLNCILEKLEIIGDSNDNQIKSLMVSFISTMVDGGLTTNLLSCWTGWPVLPDGKLTVRLVDSPSLMVRSCFSEIEIPKRMDMSKISNLLNIAVTHGAGGFGST